MSAAITTPTATIGRGIGPEALRNDRGSMRARYIIESERWSEMKGPDQLRRHRRAVCARHQRRKARRPARASKPRSRSSARRRHRASLRSFASRPRSCCTEMQAVASCSRSGQPADAFREMDRATDLQGRMPKPIGRPFPVKGADELYAELLLEAGRPQAAIEWFEKTLRRTPNRSRAVIGLARAPESGQRRREPQGLRAVPEELGGRTPGCPSSRKRAPRWRGEQALGSGR